MTETCDIAISENRHATLGGPIKGPIYVVASLHDAVSCELCKPVHFVIFCLDNFMIGLV